MVVIPARSINHVIASAQHLALSARAVQTAFRCAILELKKLAPAELEAFLLALLVGGKAVEGLGSLGPRAGIVFHPDKVGSRDGAGSGSALHIVVLGPGFVAGSTLGRTVGGRLARLAAAVRRWRWRTPLFTFQVVVLALVVVATATLWGTKGGVTAIAAPRMTPRGAKDSALCCRHVRVLGPTQCSRIRGCGYNGEGQNRHAMWHHGKVMTRQGLS